MIPCEDYRRVPFILCVQSRSFSYKKARKYIPAKNLSFRTGFHLRVTKSSLQVNYRIINGTGVSKFHMKDATSGWVYTTKSLDYEQVRVYSLSVLAIDNGKPPRSASFEYQITVEDVNEYQPEFLKQTYEFKIPASLKVGSEIGRVRIDFSYNLTVNARLNAQCDYFK